MSRVRVGERSAGVARQLSVGVRTDSVLAEQRPVLLVGLGSIGLVASPRFEAKSFRDLPTGTRTIAPLPTFLPFAAVTLATAPQLGLRSTADRRDPVVLRDASTLATAGGIGALALDAVRQKDLPGVR